MHTRTKKNQPLVVNSLKNLCLSLYASGDRIEDQFWEKHIFDLIHHLLSDNNQAILDEAIDAVQAVNPSACAGLLELIETSTQTIRFLNKDGQPWQGLLIVAPILAWTNYHIPAGKLPTKTMLAFKQAIANHIAAENTINIFSPYLYINEDLPESHIDIHHFTKKLAQSITENKALTSRPPTNQVASVLPKPVSALTSKTVSFVAPAAYADIRYLIGLIAAPENSPLFRWQTMDNNSDFIRRTDCLLAWQSTLHQLLAKQFVGCEFETLLPDAFYSVCRDANERIRTLAVKHAVRYLADALHIDPVELRAIIGGFGNGSIEEYRIGLTRRGDNENICHGVIWPLYGIEGLSVDETNQLNNESLDQIKSQLREVGIKEIRHHADCLELEYDDDYADQMFLNGLGELRHAGLPEDASDSQTMFH